MITVASIVVGLFAGSPVTAAQPTQPQPAVRSEGLCRPEAIQRALATAPGVDPGSSATVVEIRLVSRGQGEAGVFLETHYVKTEDQGGTAASNITLQYRVTNRYPQVIRCEVVNQVWVE